MLHNSVAYATPKLLSFLFVMLFALRVLHGDST
nr:MAG TPA: hypothetical protein [Bacteriophage sp.]